MHHSIASKGNEIHPLSVLYYLDMKTFIKHWSVDESTLKKDPRAYAIWRLEQRINFGLGAQKISKAELQQYWDSIDIDPFKRAALKLALS
jgi:hypothetical protein